MLNILWLQGGVAGEIEVRVRDGKLVDSRCSGVMFRGFENLLLGRDLMDALVFVCRICGVCGVSQSVAAAKALRKIFEVKVPGNGYLATSIVLATEVLLNQLSLFIYLLPQIWQIPDTPLIPYIRRW